MDLFGKKRDKVSKPEDFGKGRIYDYSTEENRINTATWLFDQAKRERAAKENEWMKMNDYYNGNHDVLKEIRESIDEMEIPFLPSVVPDPYIMVESQINPDIPEPEFHGRDDSDHLFADIRKKAVKFVCENNRIDDMNTANERRLRKYGDAFWKAWWDADMPCGADYGDIRLKDIPVEDMYIDPTAMRMEDAEYVDYVYCMHKNKFWRIYGKELKKKGKTLDDITDKQYRKDDQFFEPYTHNTEVNDDKVQILEHWFKQVEDGKNYEAGDIACTIQAGGIELRYIPCYWEKTHKQNKNYPFVHYWCIGDETGFYNRSEIAPILSMVDAADRELATAILNDAMMGNDIILEEEGAFAPGFEPSNVPGERWKVRQGKIGSVARLGGLNNGIKSVDMISWVQNQMQRANRNYDTNNGQETSKVTTASGLLQLRSDAAVQSEIKKADRNKGFCRLFELIDWLCLEFYNEDRLLFLGIDPDTNEPDMVKYNSALFAQTQEPIVVDMMTGETIIPEDAYYPRVDVTVTCGDKLGRNPATTVQILDRLAAVPITADNWELIAAQLEYLDIPQKQKIVKDWKEKYGTGIPTEVIQALQSNPQLLQMVVQMIGNNGGNAAVEQAQAGATPNLGAMFDDGMNVPTY